jgi:hypothetical protein
MQDVDYLAIAVRQDYRGGDDYGKVIAFIETHTSALAHQRKGTRMSANPNQKETQMTTKCKKSLT